MRRRIAPLLVALVCGLAAAVALTQSDTSHAGTGPLFSGPNPVTFDFVNVGTPSAPRPISISNAGDSALAINKTELAGRDAADFKVVSDPCTGTSIEPKASCTLQVVFTPSVSGTRFAYLRITDNTPCLDYINMAGSGTDTSARAVARTATCQGGIVTVTNSTTNTVTATTPTVSGSSEITLASKCSSRRTVDVTLAAPKGKAYKSVKFLLRGKTIKTLSGKNIKTKVSLRGLPRGRFTLEVRARTTDNKLYVRRHFYVTCVADKS